MEDEEGEANENADGGSGDEEGGVRVDGGSEDEEGGVGVDGGSREGCIFLGVEADFS
ncbi:hypothetical protein Pyn_02058 [Prunus yedoensis var. nudiflora]|uniref:Uncharacterized protein n=1 Tax=Prunus yedoensis var. nudiflora TaxID=2094558 RepID=A0A314Z3L7_PRUYE|nr:hypothetical protein Pyn_02058 [Prunus yedoensis var. nudiflora]